MPGVRALFYDVQVSCPSITPEIIVLCLACFVSPQVAKEQMATEQVCKVSSNIIDMYSGSNWFESLLD
jgi:hypothetical protein